MTSFIFSYLSYLLGDGKHTSVHLSNLTLTYSFVLTMVMTLNYTWYKIKGIITYYFKQNIKQDTITPVTFKKKTIIKYKPPIKKFNRYSHVKSRINQMNINK